MTKTIKELNAHYVISIIVMAILFVLAFINPGNLIARNESIGLTAEMYAIGMTLIAIPAALKLYAGKVKKIPKDVSESRAIKLYKSAYFLRLYIINAVLLINIVLFGISGNKNFMWLAVISFIVYMFCKPSRQDLESITQEDKNL